MPAVPMMGSVSASGRDVPTVSITFPPSTTFALSRRNIRHGHIGATMARAWVSFVQGGTRQADDFAHGTTNATRSGANCTVWEAQLSGATRRQIVLTNGNRTGAEVAAAYVTSIEAAGVTGVSRDGATVTIRNATGLLLGADHPGDVTLCGLWGFQRNYGDASALQAPMGPTVSVHMAAPSSAGRILAVVAHDTAGAGTITMGIANGPAYSATPAAFSGGVEGTAVIGTDGSMRVFVLPEPQAFTASANKWISFTGPDDGGSTTIGYRPHAQTPVGRGDLVLNQPILSNGAGTNVTPIYTAGAYTHGSPVGGSPFSVYSSVGFVYEIPVAGRYAGRGHVLSPDGYHGAADFNVGTGTPPTVGSAAVISAITETFRYDVPTWATHLTDFRFAYAANAAGEDTSLAVYDWSASVVAEAPVAVAPTRIAAYGAIGVPAGISNAYHTYTPATPLSVAGLTRIGIECHHGVIGGGAATGISSLYDPGTDPLYQSGWADDGRAFDDRVTGGSAGYDADAQYVTTASGDMPVGDPSVDAPATFDPHASDTLPTNLWRQRIVWECEGMVAA